MILIPTDFEYLFYKKSIKVFLFNLQYFIETLFSSHIEANNF